MNYNRPWKSFAEQLDLLKSRGMVMTDEAAALSYLERIGYYRLSAYWYPFRVFQLMQDPKTKQIHQKLTNQFVANTQFLDAVNLYLFDKALRLMILDALERIEVAIRVDVAYLLGKRDTFAHLRIAELHPGFAGKRFHSGNTAHQEWLTKYTRLVDRSKEDFVLHYRNNHGPDLPIWVAVEVWDFGAMSQLFAMMKVPDQQAIATKYGVQDWRVFQSWLRSLSYLRNLVAHHSRVWNRNVIDQPKLPAHGQVAWCDGFIGKNDLIAKPFLLLAICRHLVLRICPGTVWHHRVRAHLDSFPGQFSDLKRSVTDVGTPAHWETWW